MQISSYTGLVSDAKGERLSPQSVVIRGAYDDRDLTVVVDASGEVWCWSSNGLSVQRISGL